MKYFSILMAFIYVVLGVFVIVQHTFTLAYKIPLGIVLIVYGLFRAFSTYQKYFHNRENENRF
jgi:predicted membrane chloride channel (bestrophin family)